MTPKYYNSNTYKDGIKLDLERPKNNEIQQVKTQSTKINNKYLILLDWNIKWICKTVHEFIDIKPILCLAW